MTTTVNKGYELQATGSGSGTWGATLNNNVFDIIDQNLGAIVTKSLSSSNVTLSATESQAAILRLTGTLSANVQITTSCIGFFFVENLTTGAFTVTVRNSSVSTAATLPQGNRSTLISDASNGVRIASTDGIIPSGTAMLFVQTAAPLGWTKSTTHNDKALRVVSGTASSGGSTVFSTVFAARTISQANLPNITLTSSSNGDHAHTYTTYSNFTGQGSGSAVCWRNEATATTSTAGAHTHTVPLGGSGTPMDFHVSYVDAIIATRD